VKEFYTNTPKKFMNFGGRLSASFFMSKGIALSHLRRRAIGKTLKKEWGSQLLDLKVVGMWTLTAMRSN
jgi:hypothetical protein